MITAQELKKHWHGNEEFADLFNAVLFNGVNVVEPYSLKDDDIDFSQLFPNGSYADNIIAKYSDEAGVYFIIVNIDGNTPIDYGIIVNAWGYEIAAYESQLNKKNKVYPVVSIVFYAGSEVWDGPKSLLEMEDIDEETKLLLNDHKLNLAEIQYHDYPWRNANNASLIQILRQRKN